MFPATESAVIGRVWQKRELTSIPANVDTSITGAR